MDTIRRRQFLKRLGLGSAVMATGGVGASLAAQGHGHGPPANGPLASATVSFGAWPAGGDQPLDRMITPIAPAAPNVHALIPSTVTIKAGGSVNYIVAGFHQVVVYAPGKSPTDISTAVLIPIPGAPPVVGLIDDPVDRIYRGASPIDLPQDRVEVVHFDRPGRYLVICSVNVHFAEGMFGWVTVLP